MTDTPWLENDNGHFCFRTPCLVIRFPYFFFTFFYINPSKTVCKTEVGSYKNICLAGDAKLAMVDKNS